MLKATKLPCNFESSQGRRRIASRSRWGQRQRLRAWWTAAGDALRAPRMCCLARMSLAASFVPSHPPYLLFMYIHVVLCCDVFWATCTHFAAAVRPSLCTRYSPLYGVYPAARSAAYKAACCRALSRKILSTQLPPTSLSFLL